MGIRLVKQLRSELDKSFFEFEVEYITCSVCVLWEERASTTARLAASGTDDQEPIAGESRRQHVQQRHGATAAAQHQAPLVKRRRRRLRLELPFYHGSRALDLPTRASSALYR